jgi:hypothetical protein
VRYLFDADGRSQVSPFGYRHEALWCLNKQQAIPNLRLKP